MDKASVHTAGGVKEFEESNDVHITYLPTRTPELNMIEEFWHQAKRKIVRSAYYETFADMIHAISEYFRTRRFDLDMRGYVARESIIHKNF